MSTADNIYELVKTLPEDQANVVLVFAEFLHQRTQSLQDTEKLSFTDFFGVLKDSPNFNQDPVALQRKLRSEWN